MHQPSSSQPLSVPLSTMSLKASGSSVDKGQSAEEDVTMLFGDRRRRDRAHPGPSSVRRA